MSIRNTMMSVALAAGLLVSGMSVAVAMHHEKGFDADKMAAHMKKELNLTDKQTAEVKDIMVDMHQEAEAFRQKMDKETREKFKGVLTDEQYKKWEAMRNERMEKRKSKKMQMKKEMQDKAATSSSSSATTQSK